ncbi:MAG: hypothetical protein QM778_14605 [Myxococcales bacterium]
MNALSARLRSAAPALLASPSANTPTDNSPTHSRLRTHSWLALSLCAALAGCSGGGTEREGNTLDAGGDSGSDPGDGDFDGGDDGDGGEVVNQMLVLTPANPTHTLDKLDADQLPTLAFTATLTPPRGEMSAVRWSSDHPELGSIDASGVFKPSGAAGSVTITANVGSFSASTTVKIVINASEEGDHTLTMEGGAGGIGGVGGEGGGTAITDPAVRAALDASPTIDDQLKWLYPYDGTVWPRGLPAPLLQWQAGAKPPVAARIRIEVGTDFVYTGYFGRPSMLGADKPLIRLPIPAKVWRNALYSGAEMKVSLVVAGSDGAGGYLAFAPFKNLEWKVAPGSLKGTVYYNSYGSKLAEQLDGKNGRFGGATLAIRGSSYNPELIAGATTDDTSGCRVCHTVSGDGSLLMVQQDKKDKNNLVTSAYDLTNANVETVRPDADNGKFGWAALSPDGKIALGNAGPPGSSGVNMASLGSSALYRVSDGAVLSSPGLAEFVTRAATPMFSVDGSRVAFNFDTGPGNADIAGNGSSLVMMNIAKTDDTTYSFTSPTKLFTATGTDRPGWPFFLPDGSGVVFELEKAVAVVYYDGGPHNEPFETRNGARGELWWADLNGTAHALDNLNGTGYLPTNGQGHDQDTTLQYEPTVAPIVAGGYAWVVFTSRRLYGNVATRGPYESDPRDFDLTSGNTGGPTTKKLWVAAIDIPAKPGTDPSHPAFYLPAQELFAGNSRGFWVPDACHENGATCESGDECCGGYCRANDQGVAVCMDELPPAVCAQEYENCSQDSDCCSSDSAPLTCIANRCAQSLILL